jgi:hypothetical protein
MINQRKGFAIVYGLLILLFITITGTAILTLTRSDRDSASHYQSSLVATQAAQAALKAVEGQMANAPDTMAATLRKFLTNSKYKWFFGGSVADAYNFRVINLGSNSKYSAEILEFDSKNLLLTVEATGYDNVGSRKRLTALYKLDGLSSPSLKSIRPYALYLGGALQNCNSPINIKGDVYLSMVSGSSPTQYFNNGGTIYGNLKTGTSNSFGINSGAALTVTENAFIRCAMQPQDVFTVKGKAGFENKGFSNFTSKFQLYGNSFFNNTNSFGSSGCVVGHGSNYVRYNSGMGSDRFTGFSSKASVSSQMSLADSLGMTAGDDAADTVKLPTWDAGVVKNVSAGTYSVDDVILWWDDQNSLSKLYNGEWLVVQQTGNVQMLIGSGTTFTKKVIWITGNYTLDGNIGGSPPGGWYDCSSVSHTLIYVNGNGHLNNWGVPSNKSFRGFIYVNSTYAYEQIYKFGTGTTINGAIEQAKGAFDLNGTSPSGGTFTIDFSAGSSGQDAVQEIVDLGIVVAAN